MSGAIVLVFRRVGRRKQLVADTPRRLHLPHATDRCARSNEIEPIAKLHNVLLVVIGWSASRVPGSHWDLLYHRSRPG
jgi:hypothetical protein